MKQKLINSQLDNYKTYLMYRRQCITLAENVFEFKNLPQFIDVSYLNKILLKNGRIAFFKDEIMGLIALPFNNVTRLDVYGRPLEIQVYSSNGYTKKLKQGEFVIMYDNNGRYPIYLDVCQYAERIAMNIRTNDINIYQQRTPRIWKVKQGQEKSFRDLLANIDGMQETVATYSETLLDDIQCVMNPAPFVADKIDLHNDKLWNEFLRLIGIANLSFEKKERNIKDEIQAMQGGTIASRFSRFEPRKRAIDEINKKFRTNIEVKYYDGIPTSKEDVIDKINDSEEIEDKAGDEDV